MIKPRIGIFFGTRPEVIKLASLIQILRSNSSFDTVLINTGQHKELMNDAISAFAFRPDFEMEIMSANQTTTKTIELILAKYQEMFSSNQLDLVVVHGDTSTAAAVALAAFQAKTPIAHVEAGLRTDNLHSPFPEEGNRRLIDSLSSIHLAPTQVAAQNLQACGIFKTVHITGNTGIDALKYSLEIIRGDSILNEDINSLLDLPSDKKIVLITQHRRENFGNVIIQVLEAAEHLSNLGYKVILPAHPNPNIQSAIMAKNWSFSIVPAQPYLLFTGLLASANLIITDSGGIQEEATALGIPTLITRNSTERPEALHHGSCVLVPLSKEAIIEQAVYLLNRNSDLNRIHNAQITNLVFGDGNAGLRINQIIEGFFKRKRD